MIPINCQCKSCNLKYAYNFDDESLCQICVMEVLKKYNNSEAVSDIRKNIDILNKRNSIWHSIKWFSYFCLIVCPILWYTGLEYSLGSEIKVGILIIFSSWLNPICEWLSDRF